MNIVVTKTGDEAAEVFLIKGDEETIRQEFADQCEGNDPVVAFLPLYQVTNRLLEGEDDKDERRALEAVMNGFVIFARSGSEYGYVLSSLLAEVYNLNRS